MSAEHIRHEPVPLADSDEQLDVLLNNTIVALGDAVEQRLKSDDIQQEGEQE